MTPAEVALLIKRPLGSTIVLEVHPLTPNPQTPAARAPHTLNAEKGPHTGRHQDTLRRVSWCFPTRLVLPLLPFFEGELNTRVCR